jgi:glucose-1-phosphate cytidylyltransferase
MKTVILCGGKGTRLREETEYRPKPMVEVGGKPLLWHIMNIFCNYSALLAESLRIQIAIKVL